MAGAAQLLLLCCLLQGSLCQNWASFMPQSLEGLSGSCVMIPCTFSLIPTFNEYLNDTCVAIWNTDGPFGQTVFNSGLTGQSTNANTLQGNLTGNLRAKNCTTVFHNMSLKDNNTYYFRVQCNNDLKYSFPTNVQITITDSLPKPAITPPPVEVEEGDPVRLECSAVAPCLLLPPALTWTPAIGDVKENQQSASVTSVLNFTASRLHNGQRLQCSALYRRQAGHSDLQYENNLTLHILFPPKGTTVIVQPDGPILEGVSVSLLCKSRANPPVTNYTWYKDDDEEEPGSSLKLGAVDPSHSGHYRCKARNDLGEDQSAAIQLDIQFAPQILPSSRCVSIGSLTRCDCNSQGNPPPSLFWELPGKAVDHSVIPTREVPLGSLVMWSQITVNYLDEDVLSLVCLSNNSVGSDRFVFSVSSTNTTPGFHPLSLFFGSLVGAIGTLLMCLLFFSDQLIKKACELWK
ncbi:myelin-associated glycoprotein-like isoform X2 [Gasterosteus aculeatus]